LPHVDDAEAKALQAVGNIFCWCVWERVTDYCLDRYSEFGEKVKYWRLCFSR
jgi:hypothetical protein